MSLILWKVYIYSNNSELHAKLLQLNLLEKNWQKVTAV